MFKDFFKNIEAEHFSRFNIPPELMATIKGDKPSCHVGINEVTADVLHLLKKYNFECVEARNAKGDKIEQTQSGFVIAKKRKSTDVFTNDLLEYFSGRFPELALRLQAIYSEIIKKNRIAQSVSLLGQYVRVDSEYDLRGNLEKPEVAIASGILFGYPKRDIEYYILTRYMNHPKSEYVPLPADHYQYVRDPKYIEE